jgi:hypothetical protein
MESGILALPRRLDIWNTDAVYLQNGLTVTPGASLNLSPLVVKSVAGQTADLQQWQDSSGNVLGQFTAGGQIRAVRSGTPSQYVYMYHDGVGHVRCVGSQVTFDDGIASGVVIGSTGSGSGSVVATIKGATSQSADLQQWQNSSGTVLLGADASGFVYANSEINLRVGSAGTSARLRMIGFTLWPDAISGNLTQLSGQAGNYVMFTGAGGAGLSRTSFISTTTQFIAGGNNSSATVPTATLEVVNVSTNQLALKVQGYSSQTQDLTQWQNSSAAVLAKIDAQGKFEDSTSIGAGTRLDNFYSFT